MRPSLNRVRTSRSAVLAAAALLALTLSACGGDEGSGATSGSNSRSTAVGAVDKQHNDADIAFVKEMTPHHESAVAMSELARDRSDNPAVTALATRIAGAQEPEIAQMRKMAKAWGVDLGAGHSSGSHTGMDMTGATTLEPLKGPAFDRAFLTEMIAHHESALPMSKAVLDQGANPQAKVLAQQIVATQTAEIAEMKQLLTTV